MCTKHLVCDRKTWYVPERPGMFSKILSCVRKPCHMWTQLMIDHFLQIITRFLYLLMIFMDNVSGVPSMRRGSMCTKHLVCARNTWYVPERPDMFSEILSCVRKPCHMWTQLMIDHFLQIITRFLYLLMIFMDNVSGVPSMRRGSMCTKHLVCARNTWYVP